MAGSGDGVTKSEERWRWGSRRRRETRERLGGPVALEAAQSAGYDSLMTDERMSMSAQMG